MIRVNVYSGTNIGLSRAENQDRVYTAVLSSDAVFAVICDGMGGENAGSEASEKAMNVITDRISKVYRAESDENSVRNLLVSSVTTANAVVYDLALSSPLTKKGMGTTCVLALKCGEKLHIVSVGDSRAYVISGHIAKQITKDHTMVMQMYENGDITKDQLKNHPQRNLITKAVGVSEQVVPDYFELDIDDGDSVMLCSDGLYNYCEDEEIGKIIEENSAESVPEMLIKIALDRGGNDNISVAVIK